MRHTAKFIIWPIFFVVAVAALSGVVMLLWNAVVPGLFAAPQIDYLHALGLLVLCRILFGGLRGHGGWHRRMHGHRHGSERWAKWQAMTPEEREKFHRHEH